MILCLKEYCFLISYNYATQTYYDKSHKIRNDTKDNIIVYSNNSYDKLKS